MDASNQEINGVYALTPQGEHELRGGVTTLSPDQLEVLVRMDGFLSLGQIQGGMPMLGGQEFDALFRDLRDRRLLARAQVDPVALQLQASLERLTAPVSDAKADAGLSSLRSSGFFVEIARERQPVRRRAPGEALSAVVVEDEPTLARFIQSYLAFEGFQVRLAGNRGEIVAEFNKVPVPDLVLLDVQLPDADGFDILQRVRQNQALQGVPVIMLTGKATRESVLKGMAGGADGYVTKPFEAESLMRVVRAVVGLPTPPEKPDDPWASQDAGQWKL